MPGIIKHLIVLFLFLPHTTNATEINAPEPLFPIVDCGAQMLTEQLLLKQYSGWGSARSRNILYQIQAPGTFSGNKRVAAIVFADHNPLRPTNEIVLWKDRTFWQGSVTQFKIDNGKLVKSLSLNKDGTKMGLAYQDGSAEVIPLSSRIIFRPSRVRLPSNLDTEHKVLGSRFSPDERYFIVDYEGQTHVWEIENPHINIRIQTSTALLNAPPMIKDGTKLIIVSVSRNQHVEFHTLQQDHRPRATPTHIDDISSVAASPDGNWIAALSNSDHKLEVWARSGITRTSLNLPQLMGSRVNTRILGFSQNNHTIYVWAKGVKSPEGRGLFVVDIDNVTNLNLRVRNLLLFSEQDGDPTDVAFHPTALSDLVALQFPRGIRVLSSRNSRVRVLQTIHHTRLPRDRMQTPNPPLPGTFQGIAFTGNHELRSIWMPWDPNVGFSAPESELFPMFESWQISNDP